ncbi:MAG: cytochrome c maturation protein CcmE, partial [Candidatus Puniceispirillaceae bacterium]
MVDIVANPRRQRLAIIALSGAVLILALWLVASALRDNIVLFFTPSELTETHRDAKRIRIGGLVEAGSIEITGTKARFVITDEIDSVAVTYDGALPDLFRENQGVITEGSFREQLFVADTVLAKHDENYMPREIADSLKEQGVWQGEE